MTREETTRPTVREKTTGPVPRDAPTRMGVGQRPSVAPTATSAARTVAPKQAHVARQRAVFLDRDGVLNAVVYREGRPASPRDPAQFMLEPAAPAAVQALQRAGLRTFVVSNQPDIARGRLEPAALAAMMDELVARVAVDDVRICPHDDADRCACRKPQPGLIRELAERWNVELARSYLVGDGWRDIAAGRAAGCRTVLLQQRYNEDVAADHAARDLSAAVEWILAQDLARQLARAVPCEPRGGPGVGIAGEVAREAVRAPG